jgi:hypothetical protein
MSLLASTNLSVFDIVFLGVFFTTVIVLIIYRVKQEQGEDFEDRDN